jgi:hypothetical protein
MSKLVAVVSKPDSKVVVSLGGVDESDALSALAQARRFRARVLLGPDIGHEKNGVVSLFPDTRPAAAERAEECRDAWADLHQLYVETDALEVTPSLYRRTS